MKRFSIVNNGYDIDEVNRFIDIVIERLEKLNAENATYASKIEKLNAKLNEGGTKDSSRLEEAILAIQDVADKMKGMAREEADAIVNEAKNNANSIVHEALLKATEVENQKLLLEKNIKIYKERVKSLMEAQIALVDDLDSVEITNDNK